MFVERIAISDETPITLARIRAHCRVDGLYSDRELESFGYAASAELEAYAQLALLTQTIRVTLDQWPVGSDKFSLPVGPVIDPLTVAVTIDGLPHVDFSVSTGTRPLIYLNGDWKWGRMVVTYAAGFGPDQSYIPEDLAAGIADQVACYFDHRGELDGKTNGMSPHMARVAARYRRVAL